MIDYLLLPGAVNSKNATLPESSYETTTIGLPIKFYSATDYAGVIEAAAAGRVDVVEFGPFQYVLALARGAKLEPIAGAVRVPTGKPAYYSYGIARGSDASVKALSDLRARVFASPTQVRRRAVCIRLLVCSESD